MEVWIERYVLDSINRLESSSIYTGLAPLTHGQAMTLVKIIAWVCKHDDCPVTKEEGKDLCKAIQYMASTRPKEIEG